LFLADPGLGHVEQLRGAPSIQRRRAAVAGGAAMDVHDPARGLFGHVRPKISNDAFDDLVVVVMTSAAYRDARRVFWIVDNGTIHRGQKARDRLTARWPNLELVHLPMHASWLNQIEIYFSILARKALHPCHFSSLDELADGVIGFQDRYRQTAQPFDWTFTRQDLHRLVARLQHDGRLAPAAERTCMKEY
jgi:hypothetical protein